MSFATARGIGIADEVAILHELACFFVNSFRVKSVLDN